MSDSLLATGNSQVKEALEGYRETPRLGTKDANLFFHAGMIYYKLGNMAKAEEALNQALFTNPHFHTINSEASSGLIRNYKYPWICDCDSVTCKRRDCTNKFRGDNRKDIIIPIRLFNCA